MGIKKYLAVARNPKMALQLVQKYWKNYVALGSYSFHKRMSIRENDLLRKQIGDSIPGQASGRAVHVFLRRPLPEVDAFLSQDKALSAAVLHQAKETMADNLLILNKTRPGMFDPQTGHYRWHEDFMEGYVYKLTHFSQARRANAHPGADIKIPWETARMQYLFSLALAYRLTKEERFAEKAKRIVQDFLDQNDYNEGPNWNVSMEAGIRLANIVLAAELIQDAKAFDDAFYHDLCLCAYAHREHIFHNLENIGGKTSNHFLGDLLGLATAVAACPFLPGTDRVKDFVTGSLHHEISHQIQDDGSDFEGSTSYQRLVGELLCFTILAAESFGFSLQEEEKQRLVKMAEFEEAIRMKNGCVPQIGDNDSGRVFQLVEEETRDHSSCINLLMALGANRIVYDALTDGFDCFYPQGTVKQAPEKKEQTVKVFPDFGAVRFQGDGVYLFFTGGTPENHGMSGHTHNDLLSFVLAVGEEEYIVDPGSGEYTGHPAIRNRLRSTGSHATVKLGDQEQREMVSDSLFQWYSRNEAMLSASEDGERYILSGEYHHGKSGDRHVRTIGIDKQERLVEISDEAVTECSHFEMALLIAPGITVEEQEGRILLGGRKRTVQIDSDTWTMSVEEGMYSPQYHDVVMTSRIVCRSDKKTNRIRFSISG